MREAGAAPGFSRNSSGLRLTAQKWSQPTISVSENQ